MGKRGRPFGGGKEKTIQEHFTMYGNSIAWKNGLRIFRQNYGKSLISNGVYNVQLVQAYFNGRGIASNVFVFQINGGAIFEKKINLGSAEGMAALLVDFKLFGYDCPEWMYIDEINKMLTTIKPEAVVSAEMQGDIQHIRIKEVKQNPNATGPVFIPPPSPPPAPPEARVPFIPSLETPIAQPMAPVVRIVESAPTRTETMQPPISEPAPAPIGEVEISPGDSVRARCDGQEVVGIVLAEFPDDMEFLVRVGGDKKFIKAGDILAKL